MRMINRQINMINLLLENRTCCEKNLLYNSTYRITTSCRLFASVQSGISPVQIQLTNFQTHFSWNERLGQKDFILYRLTIFWSTRLSATPCMYIIIHAFQSINIFLSIRKVTYDFLEFFQFVHSTDVSERTRKCWVKSIIYLRSDLDFRKL